MTREISEEIRNEIINFGAFGYDAEKMAMILEWPESEIEAYLNDKDSDFYRAYRKGKETGEYMLDKKLFEMALSGDLQALQKYELRKRQREEQED